MNTKCRLYIAYGSNLNLEQMKRRIDAEAASLSMVAEPSGRYAAQQ